MTGRHMVGDGGVLAIGRCPGVGGHALAMMEDLDRPGGEPDPDLLAQQAVRRRIIMPVHLDVVVEPNGALLPFREDEGLGGQRPQGSPLDPLEQVSAAGSEMPGHPIVQAIEEAADRSVHLGQREEPLIAQPRHDPAFGDLDRHLDLRLVTGLAGAGGHHGGAVVLGHVSVVRFTAGS